MIYGLIGFGIGAILIFILCFIIPQQRIKKHNILLDEQEEQQKLRILNSTHEADLLLANIEKAKLENENKISILVNTKNNLEKEIDLIKDFAEKQASAYYNSEMEKAKSRIQSGLDTLEISMEREAISKQTEHLSMIEQLKSDYRKMELECVEDFAQLIKSKKEELDTLTATLSFFKSCVDTATAEAKRAKLEAEEKNFYRVNISNEDIEEIKKIRSIEPYLRDKTVLNKLIWTSYYRIPTNDLCNRVINGKKTGIYKITNLTNGMIYIGQAVDIGERFIQHIKRGVGADLSGKNKLYPAMLQDGVENFMFELLEECPIEELNDKEKYWIEFYNGTNFGYNLRIG